MLKNKMLHALTPTHFSMFFFRHFPFCYLNIRYFAFRRFPTFFRFFHNSTLSFSTFSVFPVGLAYLVCNSQKPDLTCGLILSQMNCLNFTRHRRTGFSKLWSEVKTSKTELEIFEENEKNEVAKFESNVYYGRSVWVI